MKRILALLLFLPALAFGQDLPAKYVASLSETGAGLSRGLTFHAPFTDPANPLTIYKGTRPLTFTRAHDATHTATYIHPGTGLVTVASADQLRIEAKGALIEGARTNILLRSRALNNAAWTATNTTADNTITGEDGVANSASWVAASADNGTICQAVTIASVAYSGAFSLKRITGIGTVMISLDNGATYGSNVASSLSTAAWYRASKANQTLANPEICLKLGTSGDNVAVDYAQIEAGAFASSRIPTTTVAMTRNDDVVTFPSSGNVDSTVGTMFVTIKRGPGANTVHTISNAAGAERSLLYFHGSLGSYYHYDGVNGDNFQAIEMIQGSTHRLAQQWGGIVTTAYVNGAKLTTDGVFDGSYNFGATLSLGVNPVAGSSYLFGHIKNLRIWDRSLTDAELQAITR